MKGNSTGYFGSETEAAVRAFQKRNNLTVDGKVGPQTMRALTSDHAKKASSTPSKPGNNQPQDKPNDSTDTGGASVSAFIKAAESKLGSQYVRGAKGPNKFDCSGLVYWCLNKAGVKQSYMTSYTWRSCKKYQRIESMSSVKRGDVLVFKLGARKGHVGIAVSGSEMIDASNNKGQVVRRTFKSPFWTGSFYCAYRIF